MLHLFNLIFIMDYYELCIYNFLYLKENFTKFKNNFVNDFVDAFCNR